MKASPSEESRLRRHAVTDTIAPWHWAHCSPRRTATALGYTANPGCTATLMDVLGALQPSVHCNRLWICFNPEWTNGRTATLGALQPTLDALQSRRTPSDRSAMGRAPLGALQPRVPLRRESNVSVLLSQTCYGLGRHATNGFHTHVEGETSHGTCYVVVVYVFSQRRQPLATE